MSYENLKLPKVVFPIWGIALMSFYIIIFFYILSQIKITQTYVYDLKIEAKKTHSHDLMIGLINTETNVKYENEILAKVNESNKYIYIPILKKEQTAKGMNIYISVPKTEYKNKPDSKNVIKIKYELSLLDYIIKQLDIDSLY